MRLSFYIRKTTFLGSFLLIFTRFLRVIQHNFGGMRVTKIRIYDIVKYSIFFVEKRKVIGVVKKGVFFYEFLLITLGIMFVYLLTYLTVK